MNDDDNDDITLYFYVCVGRECLPIPFSASTPMCPACGSLNVAQMLDCDQRPISIDSEEGREIASLIGDNEQ